MKTIAVVTTGGTIASKETAEGRLRAGELSGDELLQACDVPEGVRLSILSPIKKPSIHITKNDLWLIRREVIHALEDEDVCGAVVTTGTDTLEEIAYFLDLTLNVQKPVIITGSQRGPAQIGSDAFVNLRGAIIAASDRVVAKLGPVVLFNERLYSAKYVRKEHASNVQGFHAFGYGYYGTIDNDQVYVGQQPISREVYEPVREITESNYCVEIVKVHLDSSAALIKYLLKENEIDALVIEGLGRGQVPPAFMPEIARAKIPIVITTSALEGNVSPAYDYEGSTYDLEKKGVILGKDYESRKAKMKLYVLLETGVTDLKAAFES